METEPIIIKITVTLDRMINRREIWCVSSDYPNLSQIAGIGFTKFEAMQDFLAQWKRSVDEQVKKIPARPGL